MDLKRVVAITRVYSHGYVNVHENAVWLDGDDRPYVFTSYDVMPVIGELVNCDIKNCWPLQYEKYEMPTKLHKLLAGVEDGF